MNSPPRTFALIPAAGKSRRMGRPKLALPLGGRTVLEHVVGAFTMAGVADVLVVLAPHGRELAPLARGAGAEVLLLDDDTPDMRATIERGLDWMATHWFPSAQDGWFLSPADHPALVPAVIHQLCQARAENPAAALVIPTFEGQRGHPALVSWDCVAALRALPPGQGLNVYFRRPDLAVREVPVASPEILVDLDTPADYEQLRQRWPGAT